MILDGKKIAQEIKIELTKKVKKIFPDKKNYVGIVNFGDNPSSATYVRMKKKFGEEIGLKTEIFGQEKKYDKIESVVELIHNLNDDKNCLGFMIQLPLPKNLEKYKAQILSLIAPDKDIDGLGGVLTGLSGIGLIDFVPATVKAVITLLKGYDLYRMKGKKVVIIGQSNLCGKPLALELIKQEATVYSCNEYTPSNELKSLCKGADYIISCTGAIHLVNKDFVRDDKSQILVDVGYGYKNGKAMGDIDFDSVKDMVKYISPVPGGVGPLTVASIFENLFTIENGLRK